jgi:hypothetical protein
MEVRFYIDLETDQPHIYEHGVTEDEVREVLGKKGDDFKGRRNSRIRFGQTAGGRYLKVVYKPDEDRDSVFVITAYDLRGNALNAFRRRQRRKK